MNRLISKGQDALKIDILVASHETKKAFVVEVKEGPDRVEYVERSQESLSRLKESLPSLENYEIVGIYASLDMRDFTIIQLTNRGI